MKASLKNYRHAPRKVRLIANSVRGKSVAEALVMLSMTPHKAGLPLHKLISSAVANARQVEPSISESELLVQTITVDKGVTYVRHMPRAMGRATPINKECSHVHVGLVHSKGDMVMQPKTATVTTAPKKVAAKKIVKKS
jgi:large subunit ribosomal protein L22